MYRYQQVNNFLIALLLAVFPNLKGYQIQVIYDNIQLESNGNLLAKNGQYTGLLQWSEIRKPHKLDAKSQILHIKKEFNSTERSAYKQFIQAKDYEEANRIFQIKYLRKKFSSRKDKNSEI